MPQCCVYGCFNTGGHKFPKDKILRAKWIHAVRRKHWKPTPASVICQAHFLPTDYVTEGYYTGMKNARKRLKKQTFPSVNLPSHNLSVSITATERTARFRRRLDLLDELKNSKDNASGLGLDIDEAPLLSDEVGLQNNPLTNKQFFGPEVECNSTEQDSHLGLDLANPAAARSSSEISTQTTPAAMFAVEKFQGNDKVIQFYTGLETYQKFKLVLDSLGPAAYQLQYRWSQNLMLSVENQFFLTLIKLRRNKHDFELALLMDVSQTTVSNIFITWVNFMACQWAELDIWPSAELVQYYLPLGFRQTFPSTRVIIDGTEFPINKPSKPSVQTATFSSYKNRNTLKVLVGCTPAGLISYCSPAYGGATSDRQIVERSNLPNMCDAGDSIMADRGFNVQDIFAPKDVGINIPTFLKGKTQLPGLTVINDRKIASKRVHVERVIGLAKTYEILTHPLNPYYVPLGSKIFSVCAMLCNFRGVIIGKNA